MRTCKFGDGTACPTGGPAEVIDLGMVHPKNLAERVAGLAGHLHGRLQCYSPCLQPRMYRQLLVDHRLKVCAPEIYEQVINLVKG